MDPYKVLGVTPQTSDDDVKRAYRELARKYHPDNYVNNPLADLAEAGKVNSSTCREVVGLLFKQDADPEELIRRQGLEQVSDPALLEQYAKEVVAASPKAVADYQAGNAKAFQALVGQMYDNSEFSAKRESGFQIFYMFINIGGFFAPFVAIGVRNWWLKVNNFDYNAKPPALCHEDLAKGEEMVGEGLANLNSYASAAHLDGTPVSDLGAFCNTYLDVFNRGFHYAFIAAIVMMLISLAIYMANRKRFPDPSKKAAAAGVKASAEEIKMSAQEIRQRIYALFAVFGVVIFFWVSFHQNGYSLTYFARDYVNLDVINIDLGFTTIKGAEIFQSVNPFFVVFLTPIIMWFFGWLRKRDIEVSTPMKIAIGMGIAALAYVFLMLFSLALPTKAELAGMRADEVQSLLVTPWVMVGLYFILTVAELFISPLGLAFVSKVAPPHMQGLMQGFWLAATAVGNALLFVGGWLYLHMPMWATWAVFVAACGLSMLVMLSMVRWLERVTR